MSRPSPFSRNTLGLALVAGALGLSVGCYSAREDRPLDNGVTPPPGQSAITIQGLYEKRDVTSSGLSASLRALPTRQAVAHLIDPTTTPDQILSSKVLDSDGRAIFFLPTGKVFYAALSAEIEVPNAPTDSGFFFYGGVKKGRAPSTVASAADFNRLPAWNTTSDDLIASNGTLTLRALESTKEAGAFAIADQLVTFAQGLRTLEPTLRPPELYTFWDASSGISYPEVTASQLSPTLLPLSQTTSNGGRLIFQHELPGADTKQAYNDSVVQETFSRLVFADYGTQKQTNGVYDPLPLIRRDINEQAYQDLEAPSDPAMAFVGGFSTFLSCAFRNDPSFRTLASNGTVSTLRLDEHTGYAPTLGGEFYPGSVARTLWGIWKDSSVFNGSTAGIQALWKATWPETSPNLYDFDNTPLAAYPSYLKTFRRQNPGLGYNAIQAQLNLEQVGLGLDVTTPGYLDRLNGNSLWTLVSVGPTPISGSLKTYAASGLRYDFDQTHPYRFSHSGGARTITLSTSNPLILELFDTLGLLRSTVAGNGTNGVINLTLPPGVYLVRVRVDPSATYTDGTTPFSLTIN